MSEELIFPVPESFKSKAHIDKDSYDQIYNFAYENPEDFWKKEGERIDWIKPYKKIRDVVWSKKM